MRLPSKLASSITILATAVLLVLTFGARGATAAGAKPAAVVQAQTRARIVAAQAAYTSAQAAFRAGRGSAEAVYLWSQRRFDAEREGAKAKEVKLAAGEHLARMQVLAADVDQAFKSGAASEVERDAAQYYLADATLAAAKLGVVP